MDRNKLNRVKKLEQGQKSSEYKLYLWDHDESEQEFLNRNNLTKADLSRDGVSVISWQR